MTCCRFPLVWILLSLAAACAGSKTLPQQPRDIPLQRGPGSLPHPTDTVLKSAPLPGFTRGMNLGNALDAPVEGAWGVVLEKKHFELYAKAGFDHVRLPVRFSAHAEDEAPFTIEEGLLRRVDWAIDEALSHKLNIVVDLHHYREIGRAPARHHDRFVGMWRQIAERYKSRPKGVAFELLNEPHSELKPDLWNALARQTIQVVRESNPDRFILVDSYFWSNSQYLVDLDLPSNDPNLAGTFHCYEPILFTHQGAPWMSPEYRTTGLVFPGPPASPAQPVGAAANVDWVRRWFERYNTAPPAANPGGPSKVIAQFENAEKFLRKTGLRLYLGEFGADDKADLDSRVRYTRYVREEAERRGIGWAYWDDGGAFKAVDIPTGQWIEPLREALLR